MLLAGGDWRACTCWGIEGGGARMELRGEGMAAGSYASSRQLGQVRGGKHECEGKHVIEGVFWPPNA